MTIYMPEETPEDDKVWKNDLELYILRHLKDKILLWDSHSAFDEYFEEISIFVKKEENSEKAFIQKEDLAKALLVLNIEGLIAAGSAAEGPKGRRVNTVGGITRDGLAVLRQAGL